MREDNREKSMESRPSSLDFIDNYAPYLLNQVANQWNYEFKKVLKSQKLVNLSQWRVLAVLHARSKMTLSELIKHVTIDQPTVSKIVDKLVEQDFISKTQQADDRRVAILTLTPKGAKLVEDFWPGVLRFYEQATSKLTDDEVLQLLKLLRKASRGFDSDFSIASAEPD